MKNKTQKIIITLVVILSISFFSCTKTGDYTSFPEGKIPDQEIWNAVITVTRAGQVDSRIYATHIVKYQNSDDMIISDSMRIDFYKDGEHHSYLTADSGLVNEVNNKIVAVGNVVMVSDSGFTGYTDSLFYISDSNKVYTNGAIQIYSKEDTLFGTDFISDTEFKNWTIFNPLGRTRRKFDK